MKLLKRLRVTWFLRHYGAGYVQAAREKYWDKTWWDRNPGMPKLPRIPGARTRPRDPNDDIARLAMFLFFYLMFWGCAVVC